MVLKVGPRKSKELNMVVFCFKNCSDLSTLRIFLRGSLLRTIYSNSESSELFLKQNTFQRSNQYNGTIKMPIWNK